MDQTGNCLRVSLVVHEYNLTRAQFKVGLHPPHNFPWTHIVTDNLAKSCFLLEQFHILGNTVVRNLANFDGNGCE